MHATARGFVPSSKGISAAAAASLSSVRRLVSEAQDLSRGSIDFAKGIDHATTGDRLGRVMRETMAENMEPYHLLRGVVQRRLEELGGAGEELGLFMLAADMATTAERAENLERDDRQTLRRLRSRRHLP